MSNSAATPPYLPAADRHLVHRATQRSAATGSQPVLAAQAPRPQLRRGWLGADFTNTVEKR